MNWHLLLGPARTVVNRARQRIRGILHRTGRPSFEAAPVVAYRCLRSGVEPIKALGSKIPDEVGRLPEQFVIESGRYQVSDFVYDLQAPGLYRFFALGRLCEQRLAGQLPLEELMALFGWLLAYGDLDNSLADSELERALCAGRVVMTCTRYSTTVGNLLGRFGIRSRLVACLTTEPWNGHDDGHTLLEIEGEDGGWFAYDPSLHRCFRKNGRRISLAELSASIKKRERFELEATAEVRSWAPYRTHTYDYSSWVECRYASSDEVLADWYRRVCQVPMIEEGGFFHYPDCPANTVAGEYSWSYRPMANEQFATRFYGSGK